MKFFLGSGIKTDLKIAQGSRRSQEILDPDCLCEWAPSVKVSRKHSGFRGLHCVKELCVSSDDQSFTTTANLIGF